MTLTALARKTLIENVRDWKILVMTLLFAPFFVVLMYFYFNEGTTTYRLAVVNRDEGPIGQLLVEQLQRFQTADGTVAIAVRQVADLESARGQVRARTADIVVEIPPDFSHVLRAYRDGLRPDPAVVRTFGDPGNVRYVAAAAFADYLTYEYVTAQAGYTGPLAIDANTVGRVESVSDFSLYVPALLALAVMLLLFTAAGSLIKEKDKGTLVRLRISNMTTFEWLTAVSLVQVLIGLAAVAVAFATAVGLGYRTSGSLAAVIVVTVLSSLSIIAISVLVAAWLRTIFDLMTIGCFPFFLLMFFSGGMMPVPDVRLLTIGDRVINLNDVLPTTHTVSALGSILNYDAGLREVAFEVGAITVLTIVFFGSGTWWFTRRHMRV